ncbi:MAG TPA: DNA polymerase III subunit delta [Clostridiales bacterium]|nr:DNA polymerase III subunit delta [Clostridiales bacterium]
MSLDVLKKELAAGRFRLMYLFYGPEDFLKKAYTDRFIKTLGNKDAIQFNLVILEGKVDIAALKQAVSTFPFMHDRKLVILKNTGCFKKAGDIQDFLENLLKDPPSHVSLVFVEGDSGDVDKRLKPWKLMEKFGLPVEFQLQKPERLADWIIERLAALGVTLSRKDALKLVMNHDRSMWMLSRELEKLAAYGQTKGRLEASDIDALCIPSMENNVFALTDAISDGNGSKAWEILDGMLARKEPVQLILYMIGRHFRQLSQIICLLDEGMGPSETAGIMGLTPYLAPRIISQARNMPSRQIQQALKRCHDYDLAIKTGQIKDRLAIELLISEFSLASGRD